MIRIVIAIMLLQLILACGSAKVEKIFWQGELINKADDVNFLYWKDGNQFTTLQQDSIIVSMAGFEFDEAVYILVSLANYKSIPLTFFSNESKMNYVFNKEQINLEPIKAKNLDKDHFSFFNTIIGSAGSISRLFLNIPVERLLSTKNDDANSPDKFGDEYHDETSGMTKKIFIDNHTLFPGTKYAGFLVFEYDTDKNIKEQSFDVEVKIGKEFKAIATFKKL